MVVPQPDLNFWLSVQVFGCPYLEQGIRQLVAGVKFHSWGIKIYGCPLDNCSSIFSPATFLVVPDERTTEISNAEMEHPLKSLRPFPDSNYHSIAGRKSSKLYGINKYSFNLCNKIWLGTGMSRIFSFMSFSWCVYFFLYN